MAAAGATHSRNRRRSAAPRRESAPSALLTRTRAASSRLPRFNPCNSSPAKGGRISTNMSTRSATAVSACPAPTVSTMTASKPAAAHKQDRLARAAGDTARSRSGRGRTDEGLWRTAELDHPRLVAEDRTTAALARRIDGEYRDAPAGGEAGEAETLDERRFARARRARNAETDGAAALRQDRLDETLGRGAMLGPGRLDERDRARQCPPVAPPQRRGESRLLGASDDLLGGNLSRRQVSPRAAPLPAGAPTSRHRRRAAAAILRGRRARRSARLRAPGSGRHRRSSKDDGQ